MKTRKILAYFLGAALLVGSASCSDDLEYTPAQLPDNAQVYFPNTNPTEIDLAGAESSFDVTITRRKSDEALTVALELQGGGGNYSAPASVTFAAGEATTAVSISYDAAAIGPDNYQSITLSIADESVTTPYGMSVYTFTAGIPETWTVRYTGDYVYTQFFTGDDPGLSLLQSDIYPDRWKIEHWGNDVDFRFTWNQTTNKILVDNQPIGYTHASYGPVAVDDLAHYIGNASMGESYYEDGVFHFNVVYYVSEGEFGYGYETFTVKQ